MNKASSIQQEDFMGDKGGKKNKEKLQKQHDEKARQEAKKKADSQAAKKDPAKK